MILEIDFIFIAVLEQGLIVSSVFKLYCSYFYLINRVSQQFLKPTTRLNLLVSCVVSSMYVYTTFDPGLQDCNHNNTLCLFRLLIKRGLYSYNTRFMYIVKNLAYAFQMVEKIT